MLPKSVVLGGGHMKNALCNRLALQDGRAGSQVRSSPVVESLDVLADLCKGVDIVYLLTALDLPAMPNHISLRIFREAQDQPDLVAFCSWSAEQGKYFFPVLVKDFVLKGVSRVLECCLECGVGSLVFMSSSRVGLIPGAGANPARENSPLVTPKGDEIAYAIAMAEAEVLQASGTLNLGGSCLYTCALRPPTLFGDGENRPINRVLSWVGWGLNRVAVGPRDVQTDMIFEKNLVEAQLLVGSKLVEGAAGARAGGFGWSSHVPRCSGQAYNVTDGQPYNPQRLMDGILERLDFPVEKVVRIPKMLTLAMAGLAEQMSKIGLSEAPVLSRAEVRHLTESRRLSIDRIQEDLGYKPSVDPGTAQEVLIERLKGEGWGRHIFATPGLGWWVIIVGCLWLLTIAAFESICPAFLMPIQRFALYLSLCVFRTMWILRLNFVITLVLHLLEGAYAFRLAHGAGHIDTAPLWLLQTILLGFPSLRLLIRLLS